MRTKICVLCGNEKPFSRGMCRTCYTEWEKFPNREELLTLQERHRAKMLLNKLVRQTKIPEIREAAEYLFSKYNELVPKKVKVERKQAGNELWRLLVEEDKEWRRQHERK